MRRPRPGQMVHSVSATDPDWERVRERASAAGMSISRYLVERAMTVELPRDARGRPGPPPRLALGEDEQRQMFDRLARIEGMLAAASFDGAPFGKLADAVSFLLRATMLEMVRLGHTRRMTAMLAETMGEEEALRFADEFLARARREGLLD